MSTPPAPAGEASAEALPLLSEQWFRVADLRPRLNEGVAAERVLYRGSPWMVLASPDGSRRVRLNPAAWALVGRCDGRLALQVLWEILLRERQDDAPTQDEVILQVMHLYREGFLAFDRDPHFGAMAPLAAGAPRPTPAAPNSPLNWRLPLGNPQRWLDPLAPVGRLVFGKAGAVVFGLLMVLGTLAALRQAGLVADFAGRWLNTPHVMLMTWVAFPVLKLLHETAHALAVCRFGGRVPQWGLTLMVFTPVPYVDASAADGFASRGRRFVVSAAGAMVELSIAALAILASTLLQAGLLRDLMLVVFVLGALTSLLVNANPLLRFDGYHALCDALQLPNLGSRSARHWQRLACRALGLPAGPALQPAPGELRWWWGYAPASLACRVVLALGIVGWIGAHHFWAGIGVAVLFAWNIVGAPALRGLRFLWGLTLDAGQARRGRARGALALAGLLALLLAVPVPDATLARGVVWLPDDAMLRAQAPGLVEEVLVRDGQAVHPGDAIVRLTNPTLQAESMEAEARLAALQVELHQAYAEDPAKAQRVTQDIEAAEAARARTEHRRQHLVVRADAAGVVNLPRAQDLPGRFVAQGTVVGTLVRHTRTEPGAEPRTVTRTPADTQAEAPAPMPRPAPDGPPAATWQVRVALEAEQANAVDGRAGRIEVDLGAPGGTGIVATLARDARAATRELPSAALGDRYGGPIVTDPADPRGRTAARDVVLLSLELPAPADMERAPVGKRVWVRFDRGLQPLGWTLARRAQQSVLVHFTPWR